VNSRRKYIKRFISIVLSCAFVLNAVLTSQQEVKAATVNDGSILGTQVATAEQMADYALSMNPSPKINCTMLELAKMFLEEGAIEGVRGDIAFAQACKETGYFAFGGTALSTWNNYAGLGVTGVAYDPGTSAEVTFTSGVAVIKDSSGDSVGVKFSEPRLGVRAQIQHLKGYATTEALKQASVDPRYSLLTKGTAPNWADLNGIWAVPGPNYGQEILAIYDKINAVSISAAVTQTQAPAAATNLTAKVLTGITVTPPDKKEYVLGQNLDLTGLVATGTYSDGTTAPVNVTLAEISGFNSNLEGSQTITVTVDGKTAVFIVNVIAKTLTGIKVAKQPTKIEYAEGVSIDLTGMEVVGTYSDGTTSHLTVTKDNISGFDSKKIGSQTVTVTLEGKTAAFAVNIIPVVNMLSGSSIYATAVEVSKASYSKTNTVILETGTNFPDALSAAPLAIQEKAPILLIETDSIPQSTWDEIKRLNATKAIIIGGEVSPSVVTTLKSLGISVERISGSSIFGTAVETAKRVREKSGITNKVVLAKGYYFADALSIASYASQQDNPISLTDEKAGITDKVLLEHGNGFADTLSIGSYASKKGIPILLTDSNVLAVETKAALIEYGIKEVEVIGDYCVVSQSVEDELKAMGITVARTYGSKRSATSIEVAGKFFPDSQKAIAASGFADALAAVPLAAMMDAPIMFVDKKSLSSEVSNYVTNSNIDSITMVGGDSAVGQMAKDQLVKLAK
jgi:putative cell wall-binding protein